VVSYTDVAREYYHQLMESQFWPATKLRALQEEALTVLLRHARANTAFYEQRLSAVFRPDGSIDFDRWREIPLLKRGDLAKHRNAMLARNVPKQHGESRDFTTSGSSGIPITITATGIATLAARAAEYRAFSWHGIDYTKTLCNIFVGGIDTATWPDGRNRGPWGPSWIPSSSAGRKVEINFFETYPHIVEFIERNKADYLVTGPTVAYAIALEALRLGANIRLDRIFTYGSAPMDAGTEAYQRAFGAGLLPLYSAKDAGSIAHTCPSGDHYHVHAENVFVEILHDDGRPCEVGETGRIVVTPLLSTHQPLIRYELGDLVTVGGSCSCGRTLPVLQAIAGRVSHVFRFPDGTSTYRRLPQELRAQLKAGMWQVAQVAPLEIELRYEPLDWNDMGDEAGVIDFMRKIYPEDVAIRARRVEHVPLTKAGKLIEYSYEVDG
jgi:phenylacetate-CoA ligase